MKNPASNLAGAKLATPARGFHHQSCPGVPAMPLQVGDPHPPAVLADAAGVVVQVGFVGGGDDGAGGIADGGDGDRRGLAHAGAGQHHPDVLPGQVDGVS